MAFRIPYSQLSGDHRIQIRKDLTLKETKSYNQRKFNFNGKEITFYHVDKETLDVYLPYHYASMLFQIPLINRGKRFHQIPQFQFTAKLRDYQEEAVDISFKNFISRGSTFLNVFCSYGKTVVTAYFCAVFAKQYGLVSLITYPRVMIKRSWVGTFAQFTSAKVYVIGETPGPPDSDVQIFLCMGTRLETIDPDIRKRIGHFVIDEAHMYCTTGHVEGILSIVPMFITILTATYERDDGFQRMLDLIAGSERIIRISRKPFFVFQRPTSFQITPRKGKYGVIFDSIISQLDALTERNSLLIQTVMDNLDEKILVLTKHVDHARQLADWIDHYLNGIKVARLYGNIKQYDDASIIIGTISKIGVGFDEKEACNNWQGQRINMLILASSTRKIEQIAGRVFRAKVPFIVDIVDDNGNLKQHWNLRKKWYQSRNGIIYTVKERFCWKDLRPGVLEEHFNGLTNTSVNTSVNVYEQLQKLKSPDDLVRNHAARIAQLIQKS